MKKLDKISAITSEIFSTTSKIRLAHPEIYNLLLETPLWNLDPSKNTKMQDFKDYLKTLKSQLKYFNNPKIKSAMHKIKLYKYNNVVSLSMPIFLDKSMLTTLNELIVIDLLPTEIVTEYTVNVTRDFLFENYSQDLLLQLCKSSNDVIDYHFVTVIRDYEF